MHPPVRPSSAERPDLPDRGRRPWAAAAALAGYMGAVTILSHTAGADLPNFLGRIWDKALHAAEYVPVGYLATLVFSGRRRRLRAWAVAAVLGAGDEIHQAFVPGRDASLLDWVADVLGAGAGVLIAGMASPSPKRSREEGPSERGRNKD